MRQALCVGAVLAALSGCAPTTMSPMAIRLAPLESSNVTMRAGMRTGPRLSVPLSRPQDFDPDAPFSLPQWGVAYDLEFLVPLSEDTALHTGLQGEVGCGFRHYSCPVPVPGYGLSLGLSHSLRMGSVILAPAVMLRGATDFGFPGIGGPGSLLGAELATTLAVHGDGAALGVVPFLGVHRVLTPGNDVSALYYGAALAGHFGSGGDFVEISGGLGRVQMPGVAAWNVPIFGLRAGP